MMTKHAVGDSARPDCLFQQDFAFVSENGPSKDMRSIRTHVMRDALNKRRWRNKGNQHSRIPVGWRRVDSEDMSDEATNGRGRARRPSHKVAQTKSSSTPAEQRLSPASLRSESSSSPTQARERHKTGPHSDYSHALGAADRPFGGIDTFMNLAGEVKRHAQILLSFGSSGGWKETPLSNDWSQTVGLPVTFVFRPSFYNLLAWTSVQIDARQGREVSPRSLFYQSLSLKSLESLIQNPKTRWSDAVLVGTASIIAGEALVSNPQNMAVHAQALSNIQRHRKRAGYWTPPEIDQFVSYISIYAIAGITSHLSGLSMAKASSDEVMELTEDRAVFYRVLEELNAWSLDSCAFNNGAKRKLELSLSSDIVHALAIPQSGIHEACQVYTMLYLVIALYHHRGSPREGSLLISEVNSSFTKLDDRSIASLAWLLAKRNNDKSEHRDRALQMLRVYWGLQATNKALVTAFLRSFFDNDGRQPLMLQEAAMTHIKYELFSGADSSLTTAQTGKFCHLTGPYGVLPLL